LGAGGEQGSGKTEVIYLGGLAVRSKCIWDAVRPYTAQGSRNISGYANYARWKGEDRWDYVLLDPGNSYVARFFIPANDIGELRFECTYENETPYKGYEGPAWVGKISCMSGLIQVGIDPDSLTTLLNAMECRRDDSVRAGAASLLSLNRVTFAIPGLLRLLNSDPSSEVRAWAAYGLQEYTDEDLGLPDDILFAPDEFRPDVGSGRVRAWAERYILEHPEVNHPTADSIQELIKRLKSESLDEQSAPEKGTSDEAGEER